MMAACKRTRYRVAYVVHTFDMGGLERCIARLANHLDRSRFEPLVICLNRTGDAGDWITAADVDIVELHKRPGNDPRVIGRLAHELRQQRVDLVHSHNWGTLLETTLAALRAGTSARVHAEHGLKQSGWKRYLRASLSRWSLLRTDALVAIADGVRDRLAQLGNRVADHVTLIPNGVDDTSCREPGRRRRELRKQLNIPDSATVLGSVGRLAPVKDFATAIETLTCLHRHHPETHLVLVGGGPERKALEAKVGEAGLGGRVHLVGQQQNISHWLTTFDVFVNSSLHEGMSLSILEAMAAGLPLAVTDVGENGALAGGSAPCGRVVPAGDARALAAAVRPMLEDSTVRRVLGERARRRFEDHYRTERMVDRYQQLYLDLLRNRAPTQAPAAATELVNS